MRAGLPTDAAGLVSSGALQVDVGAGDACAADARKLVQSKLHDVEMSLRGILRGFGLKVGPTTPKRFEARIKDLVADHPSLRVIADALLAVRAVLLREFSGFEKRVRVSARSSPRARLLMTTPAVGPIVALTYTAAVDDPARFKSSKAAGAHFGLTPRKHQSGEIDRSGRISKIGDAGVREALYQAAHVMLTKPVRGCPELRAGPCALPGGRACARPKWRWRASSRWSCTGCSPTQTVQPRGQEQRHGGGDGYIDKGAGEFSGGPRHQAFPTRSPSPGRWIRSGRHPGCCRRARLRRLADLSSNVSYRVAATRRPRTEAGIRRADDAKRD